MQPGIHQSDKSVKIFHLIICPAPEWRPQEWDPHSEASAAGLMAIRGGMYSVVKAIKVLHCLPGFLLENSSQTIVKTIVNYDYRIG